MNRHGHPGRSGKSVAALLALAALHGLTAAQGAVSLAGVYKTPGRVDGAQFTVRYPADWRLVPSNGPGVLTEIQGMHQGQPYLLSVQTVPVPPRVPTEGICDKEPYRDIMRKQGAAFGGGEDTFLGGRFSVVATVKATDAMVAIELQMAMVCPNVNLKCGVLMPRPGVPKLDPEFCAAFFSSIRFE